MGGRVMMTQTLEDYKRWEKERPLIQNYNSEEYNIEFRLGPKDIVFTKKAGTSMDSATNLYIPIGEMQKMFSFLKGYFDE